MFKLMQPFSFVLLFLLSAPVFASEITIYSDEWPPYINEEGGELGSAAKVIEFIVTNMQQKVHWQYTPYELSYYLLSKNKANLAFPFFKTKQRQKQVLYSDPVFSVTSYLYFNRHYFHLEEEQHVALNKLRIGRVTGYSYGEKLDKLVARGKIYSSEKSALLALLTNEIDLLPMTEEVMKNTLFRYYPERLQLIKPLKKYTDKASLYLIASNNKAGKTVLSAFNHSLRELQSVKMKNLQLHNETPRNNIGLAKLITSEGYPLIVGEVTNKKGEKQYYSLPTGTRVVILAWSDKMKQASSSDRLYKNMMDVTKVLVLNGPQVGAVLYIHNMNIELL